MNQFQMIHEYNKTLPQYNASIFERRDEDLIEALRYMILSCEKTRPDGPFIIRVVGFEVIYDYTEIKAILAEYEDNIKSSKNKTRDYRGKAINIWRCINLEETLINLIKVDYYVSVVEKKDGFVEDTITAYIAVPRVVNKFYYKMNGKYCIPMYQITDASTYNNSTAKTAKFENVTFKTSSDGIRIYRFMDKLNTIDGKEIPCAYFSATIYKKSVLAVKYFLAKFGIDEALRYMHLVLANGEPIIKVIPRERYVLDPSVYVFDIPLRHYVLVVDKYVYDRIQICQSFVWTIIISMNDSRASYFDQEDPYTTKPWLKSLGSNYIQKELDTVYEKGIQVLMSFEDIYDLPTKIDLRMPNDYDAEDSYSILRWLLYEFTALRKKDNLDLSTKKLRYAEYIAAYYGEKLIRGMIRISNKGDKITLKDIQQVLRVPPMYLITTISNDQLINYVDCVNDVDSMAAITYTYKGKSGIGGSSNAIPEIYRRIHPSQIGSLDLNASTNSDPGISAALTPTVKLYGNRFTDQTEPSSWLEDVTSLMDSYNQMKADVGKSMLMNESNPVLSEVDAITSDLMAKVVAARKRIIDVFDYEEV